ncbi:MAG: DUF1840 domain-containing protein [Burkholderiaceae bacterium]|nr:DUF1840 domain-containing protein [Burkholderiaceae bacterium]
MSIITFRSKAAGELHMFHETAEKIFKIIGKPLRGQGVLTPEEFPQAIEAIKAEIEREKAIRQAYKEKEDREFKQGLLDPQNKKEIPVFFSQRAYPFLEMIDYAMKANEPISWGIP